MSSDALKVEIIPNFVSHRTRHCQRKKLVIVFTINASPDIHRAQEPPLDIVLFSIQDVVQGLLKDISITVLSTGCHTKLATTLKKKTKKF